MKRVIRVLRRACRSAFRTLSNVVPKDARLVVFHSVPDFADNARAVFERMRALHSDAYRPIWLVDRNDRVAALREAGISAVPRRSLQGLWLLLRARHLLSTHSYLGLFKSKRQIFVNLWHGMPLKAIGFFDTVGCSDPATADALHDLANLTDYFIATSPLMRAVIAAAFKTDPRRVRVIGQPRNDLLATPPDAARERLSHLLGLDIGSRRIALWLPTFRFGLSRKEGDSVESLLAASDMSEMVAQLESMNVLLLVKSHPLQSNDVCGPKSSSVVFLQGDQLEQAFIDTAHLLAAADLLITDYSSAFYDFLLLGRPIIFFCHDLEEYRSRRAFVLEPYEFWTPGPKVSNVDQLLREIEVAFDRPDQYSVERGKVNDLVNSLRGHDASESVIALLNENESLFGRLR